jgi:hypothetical protein
MRVRTRTSLSFGAGIAVSVHWKVSVPILPWGYLA